MKEFSYWLTQWSRELWKFPFIDPPPVFWEETAGTADINHMFHIRLPHTFLSLNLKDELPEDKEACIIARVLLRHEQGHAEQEINLRTRGFPGIFESWEKIIPGFKNIPEVFLNLLLDWELEDRLSAESWIDKRMFVYVHKWVDERRPKNTSDDLIAAFLDFRWSVVDNELHQNWATVVEYSDLFSMLYECFSIPEIYNRISKAFRIAAQFFANHPDLSDRTSQNTEGTTENDEENAVLLQAPLIHVPDEIINEIKRLSTTEGDNSHKFTLPELGFTSPNHLDDKAENLANYLEIFFRSETMEVAVPKKFSPTRLASRESLFFHDFWEGEGIPETGKAIVAVDCSSSMMGQPSREAWVAAKSIVKAMQKTNHDSFLVFFGDGCVWGGKATPDLSTANWADYEKALQGRSGYSTTGYWINPLTKMYPQYKLIIVTDGIISSPPKTVNDNIFCVVIHCDTALETLLTFIRRDQIELIRPEEDLRTRLIGIFYKWAKEWK